MEQRRDPRFHTRFEVLYSSEREEGGAGVLADLSYSGARLVDTSIRPPLGAKVRLFVFVHPVHPFELVGRVVRTMDSGFAIEYEVADPNVRRLVDDAAAIVAAPHGP